ncbi:MAG: ankyrin repeat domain-containing protein [Candidatus Babeliales bacterium]
MNDFIRFVCCLCVTMCSTPHHSLLSMVMADGHPLLEQKRLEHADFEKLCSAAHEGDVVLVLGLLAENVSPNAPAQSLFEEAVFSPLHEAALHGHAEIVEILLKAGADPNYLSHQCTPLGFACAFFHVTYNRIFEEAVEPTHCLCGWFKNHRLHELNELINRLKRVIALLSSETAQPTTEEERRCRHIALTVLRFINLVSDQDLCDSLAKGPQQEPPSDTVSHAPVLE